MSEHEEDLHQQGLRNSVTQTTEEVARDVVAAAAAVRPRPSIVFSENNSGSSRTLEKIQRQLTKVWRQGMSRERDHKAFFNPEHLTSQKRQWTQLQMRMLERKKCKEPDSLFEHMVVVGLHPDTQMDGIEATLLRKRTWERELDAAERFRDVMRQQLRGFSTPLPEPQILFAYPPGKRLPMRQKDLLAFCFPGGVETHLVERTPSLSELNEIIFGQDHLLRDDLSYVFLLKVADNATLYGVCMYVPQLVKQPPGPMAAVCNSQSKHFLLSRFSVSSYRCYCLLTKLPFFDLHFDVLNSIIAQERLDRITECVNAMTVECEDEGDGECSYFPRGTTNDPENYKSFSAVGHNSGTKGNVVEAQCPWPEVIKEGAIGNVKYNNFQSQADQGDAHHNSLGEGICVVCEGRNGEAHITGSSLCYGEETESHSPSMRASDQDGVVSEIVLQRAESMESENSAAESYSQSMCWDRDERIGSFSGQALYDKLKWAEQQVDKGLLRILYEYHKLPVPARGSSLVFQPLDDVRPVNFTRLALEAPTLLGGRALDMATCRTSLEVVEMQAALTAEEEAVALSAWTISTICRVLSLENVLALFAGVLLEKQIIVVCPNLGVLSAVVLSAIPLIRPFQWQSLMLPILPSQMLDFLDAPVPYIVGLQNKGSILRGKLSSVILVNVPRDKVSMPSTPQLPHFRELLSALQPYHSRLACEEEFAKKHPVHIYNDAQFHAAESFLAVFRSYLESLCGNLRAHTITNVQSNNDKVSLLLKESFVEDFDSRDHPFMKLFVDTQLFSMHSDAVLSFIESD